MSCPRRRTKRSPFMYDDIPAIDPANEYIPLKTFIVDLSLLPALGPRLLLDGHERKNNGQFNYLDGPPDSSESFSLILPFEKASTVPDSEESRRRDTPVLLDGPGIPTGFTFGLMDIVTHPFWFMLLYDLALDKEHPAVSWNVNANLINHFYPSLHQLAYVLTIAHFNEEPIDDVPLITSSSGRSAGRPRRSARTSNAWHKAACRRIMSAPSVLSWTTAIAFTNGARKTASPSTCWTLPNT